jgi:rfaE bifunctional protein nucleotidyltransferase chain/domain
VTAPLVVVGDALLDRDLDGPATRLAPDAPVPVVDTPVDRPRPGGAALAASLAAAGGRPVVLVTALGKDRAGTEVRRLLEEAGVTVVDLGLAGETPQKVRVRAAGQSLVRLDYGGAPAACGPVTRTAERALRTAGAVLVSDYGRGVTAEDSVRAALAAVAGRVPTVWDPHPRGTDPIPGVRLATPNRSEARHYTSRPAAADPATAPAAPADPAPAATPGAADGPRAADGPGAGNGSTPAAGPGAANGPDGPATATPAFGPLAAGDGLPAVTAQARELVRRWRAAGVAVTLGDRGALLVGADGSPLAVPARKVGAGDPCGAGDRFAATAALRLAEGALPSEAVTDAVGAASAFVAAGGASTWPHDVRPHAGSETGAGSETRAAADVIAAVRAAGGSVVATGGCFDLLHAGHVRMLETARALGDCLVVCLNSDDSVRRLKGPDRPIVPAHDRAAVLSGLACVDAVAVFSEDTPEALLARLRPDIWAKGADYAVEDLPEAALVASWGGQAVVLPYLDGRSTTRMLQSALSRHR